MTEREETILNTALDKLAIVDVPVTEAMLHAKVQNHLGVQINAAEFSAVMQLAEQRGYATGIAGATGRVRWSISDSGRHYLANK